MALKIWGLGEEVDHDDLNANFAANDGALATAQNSYALALSAGAASALVPFLATGATTGRTAVSRAADTLHPADFGVVGDGVTNDRVNMLAALAAAGAVSGTLTLGPRQYLCAGGDLTIPANVTLQGDHVPSRQVTNGDYTTTPYTIVMDPAFTIKVGQSAAITNLVVRRQGLTAPADVRSGVNAVAAFAGTAITTAGHDALARDVTVIGFNRAFYSTTYQRPTVQGLYGDCTNGVVIDNAHDVPRVRGCHFWPFLTANRSWTFTTAAVAGVADNGAGLLRVTTAAAHVLVTGDTVNIYGVGGSVTANARWVVTVINSTTIDLQGSTSAGLVAYTAGGTVLLNVLRRSGIGFEITNSEYAVWLDLFEYGYDTGYHLGAGAAYTMATNVSGDNYLTALDPNTVSVLIDGTANGTQWVGGSLGSCNRVIVASASGAQMHSFTGAHLFTNGLGQFITHSTGGLALIGCDTNATCTLTVADAVTRLVLSGCSFPLVTVVPASSVAKGKIISAGNNALAPAADRMGVASAQAASLDTATIGALNLLTDALTISSSFNGDPSRGASIRLTNITAGATSAVKLIKLTNTGTLQVVNAANTAVIMTLTDAGSLSVPTGAIGGLSLSSTNQTTTGSLLVQGNTGFYNTTPIAKPTITGSRGAETASSLATRAALVALGLVTDSTTV